MKSRNTEILAVSLPPGLKEAVKERAKEENRNVSNMTTVLLLEALKKSRPDREAG